MRTTQHKIPVIVGPTASGKTKLSLLLAERISGEIISADSRQVYRLLDIGTDKPDEKTRRRITHHFVDCREPEEYFTAGQFAEEARATIKRIFTSGARPIVVGGSGLYVRALVDGLFGPRVSDTEVKASLRRRAEQEGLETLYGYLQEVDPPTAARLHPHDAQRIIRALEVYEISGVSLSEFISRQRPTVPFDWCFIGLRWDRKTLYARIEARIETMMARGLFDEVKSLARKGFTSQMNSLRSVGYRELFAVLEGRCDLEEAIAEIKKNSRNYAKRQLTWFSHDRRILWYDITEKTEFDELADTIAAELD